MAGLSLETKKGMPAEDPERAEILLALVLRTELRVWFIPSVRLRRPPPPCMGEAGREFCLCRTDIVLRK